EGLAHLRDWSMRWSDAIRQRGATPALFMVWPPQNLTNGFEMVGQSYRAAATAAQAKLLPAGDAWRAALRDDPALPLFASDRFHPDRAGSYLAALVIVHGLAGVQPCTVPARLTLADEHVFELADDLADKLRRAAQAVTSR